MTKTLILIRHAKSDWGDPMLDDYDRPLNARGRDAAPRIGAWLADQGIVPDTALVSSARRTQETWDRIALSLPGAPAPTLAPELYHAAPDMLLKRLQDSTGDTVALVAHNPGIGSLANALTKTPPDHPKFGIYPTGATLILRFATPDWFQITPQNGTVIGFTTPRDLT